MSPPVNVFDTFEFIWHFSHGVSQVIPAGFKLSLVIITATLAACTTVKPIYHKDGRLANAATCSAGSWLECYESAGQLCQQTGYEVLDRMSFREIGIWRSYDVKQLIFVCQAPAATTPPQAVKPAA